MRRTKIKSILAYADSDDTRALKDSVLLAQKMRARLKIVDVLEPSHMKIVMSTSASLAGLVCDAKQDRLEKLAVRLSTSGLKVRSELLEGQTETAIILEVLKNDHGLLVVNSAEDACHRVTTTGMRLLRRCPCPVWVAGLGRLKRRLRVLAAVDALPGDVLRANLNAKVLGLADSIAQLCDGEFHVLNAWHAYGEALLHHAQELEALLKRTRTALPKSRVHLLKGDAGEIITGFCKAEKVDVLVLGTIARTGLGAALIGNTAETVASKIECSILAVKPDGFVCPVLPE
jgi:universal stress protein E